jgi:hypothetical protein
LIYFNFFINLSLFCLPSVRPGGGGGGGGGWEISVTDV